MIKLNKVKTDKGSIVEEINDKINKKLIDDGKVEPLETEHVENTAEAVEDHIEKAKKHVEKELKDAEKIALSTKGEDRVVFAESLKFKDKGELAPFLTKLKEQSIRRRVIPLHEGEFKFEVRFERKPLVESELTEKDKPAPESIEDCQKWIDYDIEHYGKISDNTNEIIKKAGFQIIKDDHGDYEVSAGKYENLDEDKKELDLETAVNDADIKEPANDIEALEFYVKNWNEGDNITVTADLLNVLEQSLEMYKKHCKEEVKEGYIDSNAEEIIAKNKDRNNVWYIDVKGVDQDGKEAWFSGNAMNQGQSGYGGFYSFDDVKKIFDTFEDVVNYSEEDIKNNPYDASITKFTPKSVFIGFAPIEDEDDEVDNAFVMTRRLVRTESPEVKEDKKEESVEEVKEDLNTELKDIIREQGYITLRQWANAPAGTYCNDYGFGTLKLNKNSYITSDDDLAELCETETAEELESNLLDCITNNESMSDDELDDEWIDDGDCIIGEGKITKEDITEFFNIESNDDLEDYGIERKDFNRFVRNCIQLSKKNESLKKKSLKEDKEESNLSEEWNFDEEDKLASKSFAEELDREELDETVSSKKEVNESYNVNTMWDFGDEE